MIENLMPLLPKILLWGALLCDRVFGEPPTRLHPVCFMGNLALWVERLLRRGKNGNIMTLRGALAWLVVVFPCLFVSVGLVYAVSLVGGMIGGCLGALFWVWICLAPSSLAAHALRVAEALEKDDLPTARQAVGMIVGRQTAALNAHSVAAACVETVAENLTDGVLSTLLWAVIGFVLGVFLCPYVPFVAPLGMTAAVVSHRCTNVLDAMWGKKNETYRNFGTFSARFDDVLNLCPARLALPCVALAALLLSTLYAKQSLRVGWRYRRAHASPNSAWTEAAFAGALNIKLGGPAHYAGMTVNHPWIGIGSANITAQHIRQAVSLMWRTTVVFTFMLSLLAFFILYAYL